MKIERDSGNCYLTQQAVGVSDEDLISRLVALVPRPRVNLTRFHGVFAPNSKYLALATPTKRGKRKKLPSADENDQTPTEKRVLMTCGCRCFSPGSMAGTGPRS